MESSDGTLDKQLLKPHEMIQRIHMIKKEIYSKNLSAHLQMFLLILW